MKDNQTSSGDQSLLDVFTIGYEGTDLPVFVQRLLDARIETLVDVRDLPASRKKGFSKNPLRIALEEHGIAYVHMKPLGDPKAGRMAARAGDHDSFVTIFTEHMESDQAKDALQELADLVVTTRACLMCFERHHVACHRKIVVEQLSELVSLRVQHIAVPDRNRRDVPRCSHN